MLVLLLCSFLIVPFVSIVVFTKMGDFIFRATNRFIVSLCVYMPVCLYVCMCIYTYIWESCTFRTYMGILSRVLVCWLLLWRSHLKTRWHVNAKKVTACALGVSEVLVLVSMMRGETLGVLVSQHNREGTQTKSTQKLWHSTGKVIEREPVLRYLWMMPVKKK